MFRFDAADLDRLDLRLARGSVRVRGGAANADVELSVTQRSSTTDPAVVVMKATVERRTLRLVAVHPSHAFELFDECPWEDELGDIWHYDVTVDVALVVPAHLALKVRTMRGNLEVWRLDRGIDVATNDGRIRLVSGGGPITASALGDIELRAEAVTAAGRDASHLSVYSGTFRLWAPPGGVVVGGTPIASGLTETEAARAEGPHPLALSIAVAESHPPIQLELNRSRFVVMPASPR